MENLWLYLRSRVTIPNVVEIIIIAFVIYKILMWIRGTQAENVAKGLIILLLVGPVSKWLGFTTLNYLFSNVLTWAFILVIIVFQPELRGALDKIGGQSFINRFLKRKQDHTQIKGNIQAIVRAVAHLANEKLGALIALEVKTGLNDIAQTGVMLNAEISSELLENIFSKNRPLHDGAVVIDPDVCRIKAAGCLLPLSKNTTIGTEYGTRHRAALGLSEQSDAFTIVVSEETGSISCALRGKIFKDLDEDRLTQMLTECFMTENNTAEHSA